MIYTLQPVSGWTAAICPLEGAIDAVRALADAEQTSTWPIPAAPPLIL
jgi:hypothetical protein